MTSKRTDTTYRSLRNPQSITLVPLAVPIRVVLCCWHVDKNQAEPEDLVVLGCVARIVDDYSILTPKNVRPLESPDHDDLVRKSWGFDGRDTLFELVVWNEEFECPVLIGDPHCGFKGQTVCGPASNPDSWWAARIAEKLKEVTADNSGGPAKGGA